MSKSSNDVFLVHSTSDKGIAALVNSAIQSAGLKVFVASTDIAAGNKWQNQIRDAISQTKCVLMLVTPNSVNSKWLPFEAGMAIYAGKPIFTLHDGLGTTELPSFIQRYRVSGLEELPKVVAEIKSIAHESATVTTA